MRTDTEKSGKTGVRRETDWETFGGVRSFQLWNEHASRKILEYGLSQDPAAATYALAAMNIAIQDACIACRDAKYTYWQIRPSQLDPDLKPLFPPPNHPSYPFGAWLHFDRSGCRARSVVSR
jgi:hypothetical protein